MCAAGHVGARHAYGVLRARKDMHNHTAPCLRLSLIGCSHMLMCFSDACIRAIVSQALQKIMEDPSQGSYYLADCELHVYDAAEYSEPNDNASELRHSGDGLGERPATAYAFSVHRLVLRSASEFFNAMLRAGVGSCEKTDVSQQGCQSRAWCGGRWQTRGLKRVEASRA